MTVLLHNGKPIKRGALLRDFLGHPWTFEGIESPRTVGRSGKITARPGWSQPSAIPHTLYVTVFPSLSWDGDES